MNTFDYIIFVPVIFGFIFGLFKGFVYELVSFLAIFVAFLAAEILTPVVKPIVIGVFNTSEKTGNVLAYIIVFAGTMLLMFLSSKFTEKIISKIHLKWANTLAGGILGALKFALIISVLMNVFDAVDSRFHIVKDDKKEASIGYYPILKLAPVLWKESKAVYEKQKTKEKNQPEKKAVNSEM